MAAVYFHDCQALVAVSFNPDSDRFFWWLAQRRCQIGYGDSRGRCFGRLGTPNTPRKMLRSILNWRLKTPFYYGWLVLAITSLATFAASGLTQVVLGGIQVYITDETGWEDGSLAFAATLGTWLSGMLAPIIGRLADRFGPRWLMPFGLVIAGVSFFVLSGADSVWQFYAGYVVGRAVSNPVLVGSGAPHCRRQLLPPTPKHGLGDGLHLPARRRSDKHPDNFGDRHPSGIPGGLPLPGCVKPDVGLARDAVHEAAPRRTSACCPTAQVQNQSEAAGRGGRPQTVTPEFSWTAKEATRTSAFWMLVTIACLGTLASSATGFSLVPYLVEDAGLSTTAAAGVLSLGTFLAVANIFWGYLADRITPRRCLLIMMVGAGAMMALLISVDSVGEALLFAVIWGVFSGGLGSLENMVLAEYFGRNSYGTILGVFSPVQMIALGLGPGLASTVRALAGDYFYLYVAMGVAYLLSAVLMYLARPPRRPTREPAEAVSSSEA